MSNSILIATPAPYAACYRADAIKEGRKWGVRLFATAPDGTGARCAFSGSADADQVRTYGPFATRREAFEWATRQAENHAVSVFVAPASEPAPVAKADTRPASVVALEALNLAIVATALARAGLPADTALPTAPPSYLDAYRDVMCERRADVFSAIEAAGKDATGMSRNFVEGMACAFARATAPRVATDGAGYQRTDLVPVEADPVADCYVEARTRAGILIRRHGPFVRDSADEANAYHAEECAAIGWNRGRRHDDPRTMRVRRFSGVVPAPVAMVAQPVQQAQAKAPALNAGRKHSTNPDGTPRAGWFDAECVNAGSASYLTQGKIYRLKGLASGWYETEDGDRMAQFRFRRISETAPAMVPQPVQQQQAQARKPRRARGERRNVLVRASDTGETFRVLTSVAGAGFAMIEDVPSNLHRAGELRGMLLTHGPIRKAVVFASVEEGAAYAEQSRRNGWGHRYSPAAIVADPAPVEASPAMVPQQAQQQQGRDMRAASPGPAPEILDVSELLERIQAATGPAVVWTAPDAETPRVPLEPMHPTPVILLASLAGLLAVVSAFIVAISA